MRKKKERPLEVKMRCQAVLEEDEEWHDAIIEEILKDGKVKVTFTEYGKSQIVDSKKDCTRKRNG